MDFSGCWCGLVKSYMGLPAPDLATGFIQIWHCSVDTLRYFFDNYSGIYFKHIAQYLHLIWNSGDDNILD